MRQLHIKLLTVGLVLSSLFILSSCRDLFSQNNAMKKTSTAGLLSVAVSATTTNSSRTIFPDNLTSRPRIEDFDTFSLSATVNGQPVQLFVDAEQTTKTEWNNWNSFTDACVTLYENTEYSLTLQAEYKGGKWISDSISWKKGTESLFFNLNPAEKGSVSFLLTLPEFDSETVVELTAWESTSPHLPAQDPFFDDSVTVTDSISVTGTKSNLNYGIHYLLIILSTDTGKTAAVGPEAVYVMPGVTSTLTKSVTFETISTGSSSEAAE